MERVHQPYLHELSVIVAAPAVAVSGAGGDIVSGAHGVYVADRRVLSRLVVRFAGDEAEAVSTAELGADRVSFLGVLRAQGDLGADPSVTLERSRRLTPTGSLETVSVVSRSRVAVRGTLTVDAAVDLADISTVKSGVAPKALTADGLLWAARDGTRIRLRADPAPETTMSAEIGSGEIASWKVELEPRGRFDLTLTLEVDPDPQPAVVLPADGRLATSGLAVNGPLGALLQQSLLDLDALTLADPLQPADRFLAAGAPWYVTLFGRDALWAARMLLPLDVTLAAGTLRALGRRQGTVLDVASGQEPGKIAHEIRRAPTEHEGRSGVMRLPPLYYGTVDASALWISLLHDAWRHGLAEEEVTALLPVAARAMRWHRDFALRESGFVSYRDNSGRGLANQGWKDSADAVQFADGTLAEAPIALCEVQGYAYAAAIAAAELFDAFGRRGGDEWRDWAAGLAERFRAAFWVDAADGAFPAIALDATARPVDTVTSNIAHLLGTGLLNAREQELVVARLGRRDLDSGYGLRTLSAQALGYNPLSYHCGSVWPHDTAIAINGLVASGATTVAASLVQGLLTAAPSFGYRMPELYGGQGRDEVPAPVPYPASCRPQAWSAASAVAVLTAVLGLRVDVPRGVLSLRPMRPSPVGALSVRALAGLDVDLSADGSVQVLAAPPGLRVTLG